MRRGRIGLAAPAAGRPPRRLSRRGLPSEPRGSFTGCRRSLSPPLCRVPSASAALACAPACGPWTATRVSRLWHHEPRASPAPRTLR